MITAPMLAGSIDSLETLEALSYPVLVTPKIDGIRTLMVNGLAVSRTFKPVPNHWIRSTMEKYLPTGLDGEFVIPDTPFEQISGAWRNAAGMPDFEYVVFDYFEDRHAGYQDRVLALCSIKPQLPKWCTILMPVRCDSAYDVINLEERCLLKGYEGIMIRNPQGPYKCGRSTLREQYLLKFKRFTDAEGEVIAYDELERNHNEATKDAFGHTKRATHRENKEGAGTLGALRVKILNGRYKGAECSIGTGFDAATRQILWDSQDQLLGRIVKFKYQDIGAKDAPRFPTFEGFRDEADL